MSLEKIEATLKGISVVLVISLPLITIFLYAVVIQLARIATALEKIANR